MPKYTLSDKKSFREEIITMTVDIFKLSLNEWRGGYFIKKDHGNWIEEVYVPDSRKCFCQAVEIFSFILSPHFKDPKVKDKDMKKDYDGIMNQVESNLKKYNDGSKKKEDREKFIVEKLKLMKKLFKRLMKLLKYLKINEMKLEQIGG